MSSAFPNPRHIAFAADLLTGLVIVSVAVAAGRLTWRLVGSEGMPMAEVAALPIAARAAPDLAPILAYAPFGRASANAAPATSLGLVLRGVLRAQPASASAAMIAVGTAPAQAFLIGQTVSGATIEGIEIDRVLLRVGGRLEALAFPISPAAVAPPATSTGPAATVIAAAPPSTPLVTAAPPPSLATLIGAAAAPIAAIASAPARRLRSLKRASRRGT